MIGNGSTDCIVKLPQGFTLLEYLETNGHAYIDTGLIVQDQYQCELTGFVIGKNRGDTTWFLGVPVMWNITYQIGMTPGKYECRCGSVFAQENHIEIPADDLVHTYKIRKDYIGIDDVYSDAPPDFDILKNYAGTDTLKLGLIPTLNDYRYLKRYYNCKFWDLEDNLVRDYIPCLDNNSKPCFYDTVTKKAFYNEGTAEDFTYEFI